MADQRKNDQSVGYLLVWILGLSFVFTLALWCTPLIWEHLTKPNEVTSNVNLRSVRRIGFVGGLTTSTQVESDKTVLLLRGAHSLVVGTPLQRRKTFWGDNEVCEAQSTVCWELISQ
jgi:hypothetical protein